MLPHRALLLAAIVLLAPACASTDAETATHVSTYEPTGEGGDAALLEGVVELVDACLLVRDAAGTLHLPSFPDDEIAWSDDRLRYGDATYGAGDPIALGGGATGECLGSLPDACRDHSSASPWTVAAR